MTIEEILLILKASLPNTLTPLQELVLRSSWTGKTYTSIALEAHYGDERVRKVASNLWQILSEFWEEPINKSNFRQVLEQRSITKKQQQLINEFNCTATTASLEFPNGPVSLDSRFYIERPPGEELIYHEIAEPGGAVCIKAPKRMGKSSLLLRILAYAANLGYQTVSLDFQQADTAVFTNIDKFLRWFCANISRELGLETKLNDYWNEDMGSKVSCSIYFQSYLLASLANPLVLILNEVDLALEYPEIAADFLPLLRSWYEQARHVEIWQKFRLVLAYSTEIIVPSRLTHSTFSIGLPVKLLPFTKQQVEELAQRHGLDWSDTKDAERLNALVGGNPYLIRLALYNLVRKAASPLNLQQLLAQAPTQTGIYDEYLRQHLLLLRKEPELAEAFCCAVASTSPVKLEPALAYRLQSLGLVNLDGLNAYPACELFRLYFQNQLCFTQQGNDTLVEELERENQQLRVRSSLDELTQLANRRYFNTYLQIEWQRLSASPTISETIPLSLILCDIDYFKIYNKTYGYFSGDDCLRQIANVIRNCVKPLLAANSSDFDWQGYVNTRTQPQSILAARYSGEEFVVLIHADTTTAVGIGENICQQVKELAIPCDYPGIGGLPANVLTVSIGVASIIPAPETESNILVTTAEKALNFAKRRGRDRVILA
jgi:GGDEF domain-containing protein